MIFDVIEKLTDQDLIQVGQAHVVFGVAPSTIYRWLDAGNVERYEVDGAVYVRIGDLRRVSGKRRRGRPRAATRQFSAAN